MRSLLLFFKLVLAIIVISTVVVVLGREALVVYAGYSFNQQVEQLQRMSKKPGEYTQQCRQKFPDLAGIQSEQAQDIASFQLRFLDDNAFVLEVACSTHERDPIQLSKHALPPFARRVAGTSGLLLLPTQDFTTTSIDVLGRTKTVSIGAPNADMDAESNTVPVQPVTTCQGWGYTCCDPVTQVSIGQGSSEDALDCSGQCYPQCKNRPLVLSFRTDPLMDPETRTVKAFGSKASVSFYFVVSDPDSAVTKIVLDFGDGKSQTLTTEQGSVAHEYTCGGGGCSYTAKITATDNEGITSPEVENAKIRVGF